MLGINEMKIAEEDYIPTHELQRYDGTSNVAQDVGNISYTPF